MHPRPASAWSVWRAPQWGVPSCPSHWTSHGTQGWCLCPPRQRHLHRPQVLLRVRERTGGASGAIVPRWGQGWAQGPANRVHWGCGWGRGREEVGGGSGEGLGSIALNAAGPLSKPKGPRKGIIERKRGKHSEGAGAECAHD